MEHSQCLALSFWQFDARAVATLEAFFIDAHFLTFKLR